MLGLQVLGASFNQFTEPRFDMVPPTMQYLYLSHNGLVGGFQLATGYDTLKLVSISHNNLSGPLPPDLPPNLSILNMSNNSFVGTLPSSWSKLPMADINVDNNQLTGTLPSSWSAWGNNTGNSIQLSIKNSYLHGGMPKEWVQQFCLAIFQYSEAKVLLKPSDVSVPQSTYLPFPETVPFGPLIQLPAQRASINVSLAGKSYTFDYDNPNSVCGIPEAVKVTALLWGLFAALLLLTLVAIVLWRTRKPKSGGCLSHCRFPTILMHNRVSFVKRVADRMWFFVSDIGWTIYSLVSDAVTIHQVYKSGQVHYGHILLIILLVPFAIMFILIARVSVKLCQGLCQSQGEVGSKTLIRQFVAALVGLLLAPILFLAMHLALVFHGLGVPLPAGWGSLDVDLVTFYRMQSVAEAFFNALPQSIVQSRLYLMGNDPNGVHVYINTNLFLVSVVASLFSLLKTLALVTIELHQYSCSLTGHTTHYFLFLASFPKYCLKLVKFETFPSS